MSVQEAIEVVSKKKKVKAKVQIKNCPNEITAWIERRTGNKEIQESLQDEWIHRIRQTKKKKKIGSGLGL